MKNYYKNTIRAFCLFMVFALGLGSNAFSQATVQIGTGATTGTSFPIYSCYGYNYSQQIYNATEITAAGGSIGNIQKIRFYYASGGTTFANWNNWTVYLGNTALNNFTGTTGWEPLANLTQVFSGTITPVANNWFEITLPTPFAYTGGNLLVAVDENSTNYSCTASFNSFSVAAAAGPIALNYYSDFTDPDPATPPTANSSSTTTRSQVQLVFEIPAPPAPAQDPGVPSCLTGTNINAVGTPGANETWYWQTTANGTSTANNAAAPWTIYANGTYYLRTYNSLYSAWSTNSSSISVSNFPVATDPTGLAAGQNPVCVPGTTLTVDPATGGQVNYWQGTNANGTDQTQDAATPYNVTTSGTYYVRAFDPVSSCWSNSVSIAMTVNSVIPSNASAPNSPFYFCTSDMAMPVDAVGYGATTTCQTTASASGQDADATTVNITDFSCATGPISGATLNAFIGNNCPFWYTYDIIVNGNTVATSQCNQSAFDLTPYLPLTSVQIVSNDEDIPDFVNMTATITLTYATIGNVAWYQNATGGTSLGAGTLDVLGTPVLPTATNGTYSVYATSNLGGCESATRTLVTVNVSDVNVQLMAVDATCNNGADGMIAFVNSTCGSAPFSYSIDNGATFTPNLMNLEPGTYSVLVQDGASNQSFPYNITVGAAAGPDGMVINNFNNDEVHVSWNENGSATSWTIEWGAPGFTPGTGNEIGTATAADTFYLITGLDGSTEYDIYVTTNCGAAYDEWDMVNVTTDCDPIASFPWCEDFEATSPTMMCWKVNDENADATTWQLYTGYANSGTQSAGLYTDFNAGANDDYLILPRLTLTGNEVLTFNYRARSAFEPNDVRVVLSTTGTNAADFSTELLPLFQVSNTVYQDSSINLSAYSGDVYIAFHVPAGGLDGYYLYIDDVCVDICIPQSDADASYSACRMDSVVDLNTVITPVYSYGTYEFAANQGLINGSNFNISMLAAGTYTVNYLVKTACTTDTTVATITVYGPSNAGQDGQITACRNQPISLISGLNGNVDMGGTWYNPSLVALPNGNISTSNIPGQFNYYYIVGNGVCPDDTALVLVDVLSTCNYLAVDELSLEGMNVYPNPSTGIFNIENATINENFDLVVTDLNGRIILEKSNAIVGISTVSFDLTNLETGTYFATIKNSNSKKTFRISKS